MPDLTSVRRDSITSAALQIDSYSSEASATTPLCEHPAAIPAAAFRRARVRYQLKITSDLRFAPDLATWATSSSATSEEFTEPTATRASDRFRRELLAKFESEPVEDGFSHAGEGVIERALERHRAIAQHWIERFLDRQDASFAAAAIKCLGRIKSPGSLEWRLRILDTALAHTSVEVRDAAAQAAELWDEPQASEVLLKHVHREPWLRDYVAHVIRDLTE